MLRRYLIVFSVLSFIIFSKSDNWAILACTSRYWFNYRHLSNTLSVYNIIKELGFRDDRIILMSCHDDILGDSRNILPGTVINDFGNRFFENLNETIKVDYKGDDVTLDSFLRVLTGRHYFGTAQSQRMTSDKNSNILIYLTGNQFCCPMSHFM